MNEHYTPGLGFHPPALEEIVALQNFLVLNRNTTIVVRTASISVWLTVPSGTPAETSINCAGDLTHHHSLLRATMGRPRVSSWPAFVRCTLYHFIYRRTGVGLDAENKQPENDIKTRLERRHFQGIFAPYRLHLYKVHPHMPIGKVWIYRLLFVLCVCLYGYGFLRPG